MGKFLKKFILEINILIFFIINFKTMEFNLIE
jgi:hypothetical protein